MTAMDRADFTRLVLHARALPVLAMQQVMEEISAELAAEPPVVERVAPGPERDALVRAERERVADFVEADPELSAAMHFDFNVPVLSEEEALRIKAEARKEDEAFEAALAELDPMPEGPLDLAAWLAHAYARPPAAAAVDAALARIDPPVLAAAMDAVPSGLPSLAGPLDADGLGRWLAVFRAEDPAVEALVDLVVRACDDA